MDQNIMMTFVNAKINIGLQIVRRREDGYHDLQTVFYPVGNYAGTPSNPESFCDMLEITPSAEEGMVFVFTGNRMKCEEKDNLVCRAARLFMEHTGEILFRKGSGKGIEVHLDKHIPDGAGMGGGSADASFVLRALNSMLAEDERLNDELLASLALRLGADCPFYIYNRPMYGVGVGEKLSDIPLDLSGYWLLVVKPDVYVSTRDAFAGVVPRPGNIDLRCLPGIPITEWQGLVKNDFEDSIFPRYPELREIKERLIGSGALYASMSGSGSSLYGIFANLRDAETSRSEFEGEATIEGVYLLKL